MEAIREKRGKMIYVLNPATKEALFNYLEIVRPGLDETGKVELLRKCFQALRLHDLPLSFSLFVFDAALTSVPAAIKIKAAAESHHWFETIRERVRQIGTDRLIDILNFVNPYEEAEHGTKKIGKGNGRDRDEYVQRQEQRPGG